MEETSFQEVVSHGGAQQTIAKISKSMYIADVERRLSFVSYHLPGTFHASSSSDCLEQKEQLVE